MKYSSLTGRTEDKCYRCQHTEDLGDNLVVPFSDTHNKILDEDDQCSMIINIKRRSPLHSERWDTFCLALPGVSKYPVVRAPLEAPHLVDLLLNVWGIISTWR